MNAIDAVLAAANLHDPRVWERQLPQIVWYDPNDPPAVAIAIRDGCDVPALWQSAEYVCESMKESFVAYPSGLVVPLCRVNWFWEFPSEVRQGTAEEAVRYAVKRRVDPNAVWPFAPDRVHGTCVRYEHEESYRLVQAHAFPLWAQVRA